MCLANDQLTQNLIYAHGNLGGGDVVCEGGRGKDWDDVQSAVHNPDYIRVHRLGTRPIESPVQMPRHDVAHDDVAVAEQGKPGSTLGPLPGEQLSPPTDPWVGILYLLGEATAVRHAGDRVGGPPLHPPVMPLPAAQHRLASTQEGSSPNLGLQSV